MSNSDQNSKSGKKVVIQDIFIGLLVTILGGIIVAVFVGEGRFSPSPTQATPSVIAKNTDTSAPVLETKAPQIITSPAPIIAQPQFNILAFSDDFENGNKNFVGFGGSYTVVDDSNGNKVLELSDAGSNSLVVYFGPQDISDCAIEYRVRIINLDKKSDSSGIVNLILRNKKLGDAMYVFSLDPYNKNSLFYHYPPFENIGESPINIETGKWYDIRVEMDGENLYAYTDGVLTIKTKDSRVNSGNLGFQIYSNMATDFDDVKVWTR